MPYDLAKRCTDAMRRGINFPALWHTIIKPHPSVIGVPVQKISDDHRPYVEIPILHGGWLLVDFDAKVAQLK
jgi:hypothetical protein